MYKIKIATEKLEEEEIHIIGAIEMLEVLKKAFERISEDEMKDFIGSAKVFARMREADQMTNLVRHHRR